jgi:hypothetical protein
MWFSTKYTRKYALKTYSGRWGNEVERTLKFEIASDKGPQIQFLQRSQKLAGRPWSHYQFPWFEILPSLLKVRLGYTCSCTVPASSASVNVDGFTSPSTSWANNRSHGLQGIEQSVYTGQQPPGVSAEWQVQFSCITEQKAKRNYAGWTKPDYTKSDNGDTDTVRSNCGTFNTVRRDHT